MPSPFTSAGAGLWNANATWGTANANDFPGNLVDDDIVNIGHNVVFNTSPGKNLGGIAFTGASYLFCNTTQTLKFNATGYISDAGTNATASIQLTAAGPTLTIQTIGGANATFLTNSSATASHIALNMTGASILNIGNASNAVGNITVNCVTGKGIFNPGSGNLVIYCTNVLQSQGTNVVQSGGSGNLMLTGNVMANNTGSAVSFTGTGGTAHSITGNITANAAGAIGLNFAGTNTTLTVTGDCLVNGQAYATPAIGFNFIAAATGNLTFVGNFTGSAGAANNLGYHVAFQNAGNFIWSNSSIRSLANNTDVTIGCNGGSFNMNGVTLNIGNNARLAFRATSATAATTLNTTGANIAYQGIGAGCTYPGVSLPIAYSAAAVAGGGTFRGAFG